MKLTRINNPDGTHHFINSETGEKVTPKEAGKTNYSNFLSFLLNAFGFISLICGILYGISFIKENSLFGIAIIISSIVTSIIFFALSKILKDLGIIKGKLKNQN